jgi:hypothetical protein
MDTDRKRPWDGIISEEEQRAYRAAGFGRPGGIGSRPALLIIDVQYRTVGTTPMPFWEAIKEFPTSCGEVGWSAVRNIQLLLAEFRRRGWPVLYPHVAPKQATDGGRLAAKVPAIMTIAERGYDFVAEVAPQPGDRHRVHDQRLRARQRRRCVRLQLPSAGGRGRGLRPQPHLARCQSLRHVGEVR